MAGVSAAPVKKQKVEIQIVTDLMENNPSTSVDKKDIKIVKDLAKRVYEISQEPQNIEKIRLWKDHNALVKTRPLILCIPENAFDEILPKSILKTNDPFLREYEWYLRSLIYHWEELGDDYVISSRLKVPTVFNISSWGIEENWHRTGNELGAAKVEQVIKNEVDIEKLKYPELTVDLDSTNRNFEYIGEIFGDILDVKLYFTVIPAFIDNLSMIGYLARSRGMDQIFIDMIDRPEWVHKIMEFLTGGILNLIKKAEENCWLGLNNADDYIGTGGLGYTDELPQKGFNGVVRLIDLWGSREAQEMTGISPAMLEEFVLPYQIKILENFGFNCYGCCEDLTKSFEVIKKIPRLRRVSVAPWTNISTAAEALQDRYVYVWKPNPAVLAMESFDGDLIKKIISHGFELTKECIVEIIMKDTHTLRNEPERLKKWAKIAKQLACQYN